MIQTITRSLDQRAVSDYEDWLIEQSAGTAFHWDWNYHKYIIEHLRAIERGDIRHLMISCPPQHGKSQLVTIRYPAYRLIRNPALRCITAAYNQSFSEQFSRYTRRIAEHAGLQISQDRRAVSSWETTRGGGLRAVGVGAGVTGNPGDLIIIDDPVKSREEANSEAYRERCWEWYTNDLYTRLQPGGHIILIMTRWHEDDLAGRILASADADNWTKIVLPALAVEGDPLGREPGEALCPDRFDTQDLMERKALMGSYAFQALYQGSPTPEEGARFRRSWFKYWTKQDDMYQLHQQDGSINNVKVSDCRIIMTIDPAATENVQSDFFCASTWAITPRRDLLLLDVFRERAETTKHEQIIQDIARRWNPSLICVENVSFGLNIIQRMIVLGLPVVKMQADRDKVSRSLPIQARYESGSVYHKQDASWLDDIEDELLHFPLGKHDDFVDTASYAGVHIAQYGLYKEKPEDKEPEDNRKRGSVRKRFGYNDKPDYGYEEYV